MSISPGYISIMVKPGNKKPAQKKSRFMLSNCYYLNNCFYQNKKFISLEKK